MTTPTQDGYYWGRALGQWSVYFIFIEDMSLPRAFACGIERHIDLPEIEWGPRIDPPRPTPQTGPNPNHPFPKGR